MEFSTNCRLCPRLANFLDGVRQSQPDYFALPVPSFGATRARLLVVGLAPGMHGANRTGRPFTGDHAGILLYSTLHKFGFASHAEPLEAGERLNSKLSLHDCRITNAVRCLPPQNKPALAEVRQCNGYLTEELAGLPKGAAVLALGTVAHLAVLRALNLRAGDYAFGHGNRHELSDRVLYDSYHCSRYNTQTKRLTEEMFHGVFNNIKVHLSAIENKSIQS